MGCTNSENSSNTEDETAQTEEESDFKIQEQATKMSQTVDPIAQINEGLIKEAPVNDSLVIANPYKTIKRIFDTYNEYQESTDSPDNLDSLKQSLKILETSEVDQETLTLVINVWMYYTVTDFKTHAYTGNVLRAHKEQSIKAIKNRIKNKMDWEIDDGAPYSELPRLLESIE